MWTPQAEGYKRIVSWRQAAKAAFSLSLIIFYLPLFTSVQVVTVRLASKNCADPA
jgi:hypothetical protein